MEGEFVDSLLSFHQHDQGRLGPLMPCFWWTLVHFRSKEKLFSGRQSATRVKRCRSFFCWRDFITILFYFIFFRIFCFVYLRQYLNKNIYRFTSDTNQTPDVGALRCAGGGVGADYRLPVPQRPTTTRFFALPLKLIPPVSIDFTAVYSPSTCYWHVSVSLISFIKKKIV